MKAYKPAIIAGAVALIAVIITVIVVTTGNAAYGLYISSVSGNVNISNPNTGISENAVMDRALTLGDVITVNDGASCTLTYRSRDNFDSNYAVLESSTQIFVTGDFNGKSDSELYLNRGSVFVSSLEKAKANIIVRTENSSVSTENAAVRVHYEIGENKSTSIASFGGNVAVQLYSVVGTAVDKDGNPSELPEYLGSGLSGRIYTDSDNMPKFDFLNLPLELNNYSAFTLKEVLTAAAFHELAFSTSDIKAAYDSAPSEVPSVSEITETEMVPVTEDTSEPVTIPSEIPSETTAETSVTTEDTTYATTTAQTTTAKPVTTTVYTTTTAARTTTAAPSTTKSEKTYDVYIIIEDEIIVEQVPYGGSATKPADPVIEGKIFKGWDSSFDNITGETTITAIFEDADTETVTTTTASSSTGSTYKVTFNINGVLSSQDVPHGGSANPPSVNVPGYAFLGWDKSTNNITGDTIITAILVPSDSVVTSEIPTYTVTFVIDGMTYSVPVKRGESVTPPVIPDTNIFGQTFLGWDANLNSVTSDMTVNAIFG